MKIIDLFANYLGTQRWLRLQNSSKRIYMNGFKHLEPFYEVDIRRLKRIDVMELADSLMDAPSNARGAINVLNNLYRYAIDCGLVDINFAQGVDVHSKSVPYERWEENEIDLFLSTAPPWLKSAFLLALYTGQRKSDIIRMKWTDYDGKFIKVKQQKTGTALSIPVHPKLRADLEKRRGMPQPKGRCAPYIILNSQGDPWTRNALQRSVIRHCAKLGIKNKSIHGIRSTTASILAEAGCTPHQIMAITGHKTMKEIERYTLAADQKRLANEALKAWETNHG